MAKQKRNGSGLSIKRALPDSARFLKASDPAVKAALSKTISLQQFRASSGKLNLADRRLVVDQALILFEQNYAHLPFKKAMHAVDPVQQIRLIKARLDQTTPITIEPELEFHRQMIEVFNSVRDLHTNYILPSPYTEMVAFLPFMIEDYFENGRRHYLISHVASGFHHHRFGPGAEVLYWNGAAIDRAVTSNGNRYGGSNLEARHARGLQTLTHRALGVTLPPDEDWVIIRYKSSNGTEGEIKLDWLVLSPEPENTRSSAGAARDHAFGIDLEWELIQRIRKLLFAPKAVSAAQGAGKTRQRVATIGDLTSRFPEALQARAVKTPHGQVGYVRIRSFNVDDEQPFISEFVRLIAGLPREGLILDVRDNGGGLLYASEGLLQLLTPRSIEPEPAQFISSPLNLALCELHATDLELKPWIPSLRGAVETGAIYSNAFPITPPQGCNNIGQVYHGPVVLITNALCYSATDIFAAGFQDHKIGRILGTSGNTGAGGANVWPQAFLLGLFDGSSKRNGPYRQLPNGGAMRIAIRRTLRVGPNTGTPVEDLGVVPDKTYLMTRQDLLDDNVTLIRTAAKILSTMPVYRLDVKIQRRSRSLQLSVDTGGFNRLDIYVDGRPLRSLDVKRKAALVELPKPTSEGTNLQLRGFKNGVLVAARQVLL